MAPDLADLHNTLAAKKQAEREALAAAEAAIEAKKAAAGAEFIKRQIDAVDASIASMTAAAPAPTSPPPPAPRTDSKPASGASDDTKE